MKATRLYAQVLVDVVMAPNSGSDIDAVSKELQTFAALAVENAMFLKVFDNPTIGDDEKQKALKGFTSKMQITALTDRFLSMLTKRNRLALLPQILSEVEAIQVERKGGIVGELTSAIPLDPQVATGVADALAKKLHKPVQLKHKVDPGIIAGMRVTIGGITYDGSVKGKLEKVAESFQ